MSKHGSNMRFNPPPSWPPVPPGWVPPAGWVPDPAWGPAPVGWQLWVSDSKPNWVVRHKVLAGVGGGFLGLMLLLCMVGAINSNGGEKTSKDAVAADEVTDVKPDAKKAVADKAAAAKAAADKAVADKAAAAKAAADKAVADKAAAAKAKADKAAADKAAAEEKRSSLPAGTDCTSLATEAVRISNESTNDVKVVKVRAVKVLKDNRSSFNIPTGSTSVLVLSCTGRAVASTGEENVPIVLKMTVDSDGEYFVGYDAT